MIGSNGITKFQKSLLATRNKLHYPTTKVFKSRKICFKRSILSIYGFKTDRLYAKYLFYIPVSAPKNDITVLHQRLHDFGSGTPIVPKFLTEIQITGDSQSPYGQLFQEPHGMHRHHLVTKPQQCPTNETSQHRRISFPQSIIPGRNVAKERTLTVVNHIGITECRTTFQKIKPHALTTKNNALPYLKTVSTGEAMQARATALSGRRVTNSVGIPKLANRNGHISFTATVSGYHLIGL